MFKQDLKNFKRFPRVTLFCCTNSVNIKCFNNYCFINRIHIVYGLRLNIYLFSNDNINNNTYFFEVKLLCRSNYRCINDSLNKNCGREHQYSYLND